MAAPQTSPVTIEGFRRRRGSDAKGQIFLGLLLVSVTLAIGMVGSVLWSVLVDSWDLLSGHLVDFLTSPSSADPGRAGVAQGIRGSILIAGIVWHAGTDFWGPQLLSDLSLEAASDDGVLPESDPTLFAITIAVLAAAATALVVVTRGNLGRATDVSAAEVSPHTTTATTS